MQRSILENRLQLAEQNRTTKIKELREMKTRINKARRENVTSQRILETQRRKFRKLVKQFVDIELTYKGTLAALERERHLSKHLEQERKDMTMKFQLEFERIKRQAIPKRASQVIGMGMAGGGNGTMTKWQEAKIRRELNKSKLRTKARVSMVQKRYETIKTYKVLCERLMKLVGAKNQEELKKKLKDGEDRNFTLVNDINDAELELRYLHTEIAERKADLEDILKTEEEYDKNKIEADRKRPHKDVKSMLQNRLERKQEELNSLTSTIEKLEEFLQIFQATTKKMYISVMKDVKLTTSSSSPSSSQLQQQQQHDGTLAISSATTRPRTNLNVDQELGMGFPTVDVDFWTNMNYRELPPSLLTSAIDIVNVQLINRVCNFVSKASTPVSKTILELARNGPRKDTKPSDHPTVKARIAIMAEKDKELSSNIEGTDMKSSSENSSHHHVTDTNSFVREVVAKELVDLEKCRVSIKEKLMGNDDDSGGELHHHHHHHHHESVIAKRRVSLGGRANHILDVKHEINDTKEQSSRYLRKVNVEVRHASIQFGGNSGRKRASSSRSKQRVLRSGEIVHRKGGMLKFRSRSKSRNRS